MNRRDRRLLAAVIVIAVAAVVALVVLVNRNPHPRTPTGVGSDELTKIPVSGATLAAEVITPKGSGPAPLLVIPSSWCGGTSITRPLGTRFARAGYQVVDYAQRGCTGSTGTADFAGTDTQQDASTVIDWALKHTRGDPKHVGMLGASYGAGISLLTAAHDKRVRAVVALSTWTDVTGAFVQNGTPNVNGLNWLVGPKRAGHFDSTVLSLRRTLATAPRDLGTMLSSISAGRSPDHYLAELNRNRPAIMIANAFEDSILNPMPLVGFFDRLTTPKRLELIRGDHTSTVGAALVGGPSATVNDAQAWLDHYLRGTDTSIAKQPPILLRDISTTKSHTLARWPGTSDDTRIALGTPAVTGRDTSSTWQGSLRAGTNSAADFGPSQQFVSVLTQYQLPTVQVSDLSSNALVWNAPDATRTTQINGTPSVHLQLGSASGTLSVYAYLYDVNSSGTGTLLDMAPYSATGLAPGTAKAVTFDMAPTSWTLPSGHHLMLVLDGADVRYQSLPADGTTMTVSSSAADPAALTVPITS